MVLSMALMLVLHILLCQAAPVKIFELTDTQKEQINNSTDKIKMIKENYWRNRTYYSRMPPIIQLTEDQKTAVMNIYGNFFKAEAPKVLTSYVYNGFEITPNESIDLADPAPISSSQLVLNGTEIAVNGADGDAAAAVPVSSSSSSSSSLIAVCPSTGVYEQVQFVVNGEDEVLQMTEIDSGAQWILNESCDSSSGNVAGTVCRERERLITATVIDLETFLITTEQIKVVCCTAYRDDS